LANKYDGELMNAQEVMRRWPALRVEPESIGFYSYDAGFMEAKKCMDILVKES
jgi:hypothetical protein